MTEKTKDIENFVLDVDGVMTTGHMLYNKNGKEFKIFGPDDHDALKLLKDKLNIFFIFADKRGFPISKKRIVEDMGFNLYNVDPFNRTKWLKEKVDLNKTIFMGDGLFDIPLFKEVGYSICTKDSFYLLKENADYVTHHEAGNRAVAEAVVHILKKFFNFREEELISNPNFSKKEK